MAEFDLYVEAVFLPVIAAAAVVQLFFLLFLKRSGTQYSEYVESGRVGSHVFSMGGGFAVAPERWVCCAEMLPLVSAW